MAKIIYKSRLAKWLTPLGTCHTITLGWWILTEKSKEEVSERLIKHEYTHVRQYESLFGLGMLLWLMLWCIFNWSMWYLLPLSQLFYWWYGVEWLVRFIIALKDGEGRRAWYVAYKGLAFEKEADAMMEEGENPKREVDVLSFIKYYKGGVN